MTLHDPQLSIGVLAHNEKLNIEKTLQSLISQDVFQKFSTELIVVANGCTDETAALAKRSLGDHHPIWSQRGTARVEEIIIAGKPNAWNEFVHVLSSPFSRILILVDADITFLSTNTISSMISKLERSPEAVVCVDRPVKDIEISATRNLFQKLLVAATPIIDEDNVPLCGQLYCVFSAEARQIKLPVELPGEDGFLRALLLTHGFTRSNNPKRIVLDASAGHSFASVATASELFNHERWIVSGSIISMLLYERFWMECAADRSAMTLMKRWQEQDPEWLPRYIQSEVRRRGWRLLPRPWWIRRWEHLRQLPLKRKLLRFPVSAIASAIDALIFISAIRDVRLGRAFRYWGRK